MLELLTPRVIARSAGRYRQLGLDEAVFSRSRDVIVRALAGGKQLTRKAIAGLLEAKASPPPAGAPAHPGPPRAARSHLFRLAPGSRPRSLLDDWAPKRRVLARDEALAELAERYFTSHGPATVRDFV